MDELNRKLIEWRWPNGKLMASVPSTGDILWGTKGEQHWVNFPKDLNDCFRWLVPKLRGYDIYLSLHHEEPDTFTCAIHHIDDPKFRPTAIRNEEPALALCRALEGLVDGGE